MTKRFAAPMGLVVLAAALQFISHHYGSRRLHLVFLLLTYTLVADALWSLGKLIANGETFLPALPVYLWLFRFLAIATIAVGLWSGWQMWAAMHTYQ